MKYLLFQDVDRDYGADFERTLVGAMQRGFGAYEDADAAILISLHPENLLNEITEAQYDGLKKKLSKVPVSYRQLGIVRQDPSKDPNAVYAEAPVADPSEAPVEELISVGEAEVEDTLEDTNDA